MSPQLPEPVRSTMHALTSELVSVLGDRLVGVYLGGSAATGDFCESSSDLDFLVVTDGPLSMEDLLALKLVHQDLLAKYPYAARLEGDYAPRESLTPEGTAAPVPGCEVGVFVPRVGEIVLSADNIHDMREHGIAFYGPSPREVLPEVTPDQVRAAVRTQLVQGSDVSETPQELAAEVLNLLRRARVLETGVTVSKSEAAAWALTHLSPAWRPTIQAALRIRCGKGTPADEILLRESLPKLEQELRNLCICTS